MIDRTRGDLPDLTRLVADDALFDRAVAEAQADAARRHRLLGQPLVIWRDGRVVLEQPGDATADGTDQAPDGRVGARNDP
jgi:hypothetical protein